ncbi:GTP diphosphokinase [Aestuariirhabdus litorea]|uniref:GTP pyrophosphokinase n=1 Tax=Aestuariirhabdus litorea TaxID=2528527 RepID=A0A3P3VQZ2_9GAMM|nr:GTP diphosphokinase [Aestuariirhabdus litorea]RRJ85145.1 GTP diphosphokinase [Aestuariirhabdus litorea]RWW98368.1 GTP diphosphokinase [Endozoicomonadaceae bacterium GTF-13]
MVKVREDHPVHEDGSVNIDAWLTRIGRDSNVRDVELITAACQMSCDASLQGGDRDDHWQDSNSYRTGLEMAEILAELNLDQESLIAAILYRGVREGKLELELVKERFGAGVAKLISGVLGMAAISAIQTPGHGAVLGQVQGQLENVRKMLVSIIDDVRVALIKLSERTCAIRAVKNLDKDKRLVVAREVFEIYAPLAHRLGIGHIKWELEDLSFRYLKPQDYKKIARLLDERRLDRQQYIDDVMQQLQQALAEAGIKAEISGRAKHIYSIWRKMRRKGIDFRDVYDIRAVRVLVPQLRDCYGTLGIVHSLWSHIPREFDDYIATPKENGYRSLHTAVIGPGGKTLEVQIRTHEMHEEAELGVCAHWRYKGTDTKASGSYEEKIAWLRQVMEWHEDIGDLDSLAGQLRSDIESDRIYVFTKNGHVVDLSVGSTPIDFAYRIHTEVGNSCRGAKVGGRIVPLTYSLKTGDQVEILTAAGGSPSRDWLNPNLGYITTSRARSKVMHWFKEQDRDQNELAGRQQIEHELKRLALVDVDFDALAPELNYKTAADMFAAVGAGDLRQAHVIHAAQRQVGYDDEKQFELQLRMPKAKVSDGDIRIRGVGNLLTQMAGCCHPLPGDPIIGYITLGRGVTIHRQDCQQALLLQERESNRLIEVDWGGQPENTYAVGIELLAYDRPGLIRDITMVLANEKVNVIALNTLSDTRDNMARMTLTIEVDGLDSLSMVLARINQLPNVIEASRSRRG